MTAWTPSCGRNRNVSSIAGGLELYGMRISTNEMQRTIAGKKYIQMLDFEDWDGRPGYEL